MPRNQSFTIDRLWMGSASTPPWMRRNGQIEDSKNIRFDIRVGGAVKRNATNLIADLLQSDGSTPLDGSTHYYWTAVRNALIAIGQGEVFGWNIETGAELTIDDQSPQGSEFINTGSSFLEYITVGDVYNARRDIRTASSFDTVIVVNDDFTVDSATAYSWQQSANFLKNGDPDNSSGAPTAAESTNSPLDNFSDFYGLPETEGEVFIVKLSEEGNPAGTYLRYDDTVHSDADGYFPEHDNRFRIPPTEAGQSRGRYDATTMPHRIIYDEDNQKLILDQCPWRQRVSGNNHTNSTALRRKNIVDAEFYDGRLFLITQDGIIVGSRRDDYFNLWHDNVESIGENSRIVHNIQISGIGNTLRSAVVGDAIVLLTQTKALVFGPPLDESLSATNGTTRVLTDMQLRNIKPASSSGMASVMDQFRDMHQFQWTERGVVYSSILSAHERDAIDDMDELSDVIHQIESTTIVTDSDSTARIHEMFSVGSETVQSAWGVFDMGDDGPAFFHPWNGLFYIVTRDAENGYSLLSYLHREQLDVTPKLDRMELVEGSQMTYDAGSDTTTMTHTGRNASSSTRFVQNWTVHEPSDYPSDGSAVFDGDLTGADGYLGFVFDCEMTLTPIYPGTSATGYTVQRLFVFHYESTKYTMQWWEDSSNTLSATFDATAGVFDTFYSEMPVKGDPRIMTFKLTSNNPHPCAWLAIEDEFIPTARRIP